LQTISAHPDHGAEGEHHDVGHVWMELLVLVCSKLTPKLTLSQTHVLVWC
jgi:hypothetical protein